MSKVISVKKKSYLSGLPDIDIDFGINPIKSLDRRDLIRYLEEKYNNGENIHVAAVGNLNLYALKSAILDLASTFEIPPSETFAMTKGLNDSISIAESKVKNKKVKDYFDKYPQIEEYAETMVGVGRNLSMHAGGVIISDKDYPMNRFIALQKCDDIYASVYTKDEIEKMGFVKMDILGVNALTQISYCNYLINGKWDVAVEDHKETPEVFQFIKENVRHKNVFQLETPLGKKCLKDLKIKSIQDLANASGLIRLLGTEDGRKLYEQYRQNSKLVEVGDNDSWKIQLAEEIKDPENLKICEEILAPTYGVMIYQEQLINLIVGLSRGKYTFNDGNKIRKKLGLLVKTHGLIDDVQASETQIKAWHKDLFDLLNVYLIPFLGKDGLESDDPDVIDFINCTLRTKKNGRKILPIPEKGILNWFVIGSTYLFSIIHSVGYSVISYNQMYQKTYHPVEFWTSALALTTKYSDFIEAMQSESGINILPPCVNKSSYNFSKASESEIRFGLNGIKSLDKAAAEIINKRELGGEFKSVKDFVDRVNKSVINKKVIRNLLFSNAFNCFGEVRKVYAELIAINKNFEEEKAITNRVIEREEFEVLTTNISFMPEDQKEAKKYTSLEEITPNSVASCMIKIEKIAEKTTKNNKPYLLYTARCLKSNTKKNLFCWNAQATLKVGENYIFPVSRNDGDFYTLKA